MIVTNRGVEKVIIMIVINKKYFSLSHYSSYNLSRNYL